MQLFRLLCVNSTIIVGLQTCVDGSKAISRADANAWNLQESESFGSSAAAAAAAAAASSCNGTEKFYLAGK